MRPAVTSEPWSFEDGSAVAQRILREYAKWRLDSLPVLPREADRSVLLLDVYRRLERGCGDALQTARIKPGVASARDGGQPDRGAEVVRAVLEVVHRHLIAAELQMLLRQTARTDLLMLVLLAERRVETLVMNQSRSEGPTE